VGRGFSPDRSLSRTEAEVSKLVGASAPSHLISRKQRTNYERITGQPGCGKLVEKAVNIFLFIAASKEFTPDIIALFHPVEKSLLSTPESAIRNLWINADYNDGYIIRPAARVGGLDKSLAYFLRILAAHREDILNILIRKHIGQPIGTK
jgi:hypothetical protein